MATDDHRRFAIVTGASRGAGALTAVELAKAGYDIGIGYREKAARADRVAARVAEVGRRAVLLKGDISTADGRAELISAATAEYDRFDALVLNAAGGLESGRDPTYPMLINRDAQVDLVRSSARYLADGGRVVYVTSHFAHGYPDVELPVRGYEPVAASKHAGERALRELAPELSAQRIGLVVVTGDVLEDSAMIRLLDRAEPGLLERRRKWVGALPTELEFARVVARGVTDPDLPVGAIVS